MRPPPGTPCTAVGVCTKDNRCGSCGFDPMRDVDPFDPYQAVYEFHTAFGLPRTMVPNIPHQSKEIALRLRLIHEEYGELLDGIIEFDIVKIADALTDISYVVNGMAVVFGINLTETGREVHRSNMAKLGEDGKVHKREDGKVLKPPGWTPPDIAGVLKKQLERAK